MIRAKNLRIGNYVEYLGNSKKVSGLDKETIFLKNTISVDYINIEEVFPIILTEEWLIKFGFKNIGDEKYPNYNLGYYTCMWRSGETNICNNHGFIKDLKHVHELQNLYFALTNKEL